MMLSAACVGPGWGGTHLQVAGPCVYHADAARARCCGQSWVGAQRGHLGRKERHESRGDSTWQCCED